MNDFQLNDMNNLFKNAKFGDKFRSRDGELNIYIRCYDGLKGYHYLLRKDHVASLAFNNDGSVRFFNECLDIVGKWQEPINEEELDNMATLYRNEVVKSCNYNKDELCFLDIDKAYIAGYRKALELKS